MLELFPAPYGATMLWCRYISDYSQKWMASQRNAVLFFVHQRAKQKVRHNIEHISDADKTIPPLPVTRHVLRKLLQQNSSHVFFPRYAVHHM